MRKREDHRDVRGLRSTERNGAVGMIYINQFKSEVYSTVDIPYHLAE
jgi:hypothetical protein